MSVEREQEKVLKKLRTLSGSASEKLQKIIDQVESLRDQLNAGMGTYLRLSIFPSHSSPPPPESVLSPEHCQAVKECTKTAKETCQGISTEHKEVHAAISKFGRAIDKVCVSLNCSLLLSSNPSLGWLKYTTLKCCSPGQP